MRVYLMRHGLAVERDSPNCPPDPERPLTEEGRKRVRQAAQGLKWLGIAPSLILTSPYVRAQQTAEEVVAALGLDNLTPVATTDLVPDADPGRLRAHLRRRRASEVLCTGHLPHLDLAIAHLLGTSDTVTELKKASVAAIDLPAAGTGTLLWVATAKMLRKMGA